MSKEKIIDQEILKALSDKYDAIVQLVNEYNNLASASEIKSRVGCIINEPDEENEHSYYDTNYTTEGWQPSSLQC